MAVHTMPETVRRRRISAEEYHRMIEAGILGEDERLELLEGEIVEMTPIGRLHASTVNRILDLLHHRIPRSVMPSVQNPVQLSDFSEPQPDIAVLKRREDHNAGALPGPGDVALLIEVADSSLLHDRNLKIPLCAQAGVAEVWLVDVEKRTVEVFRDPRPEGYAQVHRPAMSDTLTPVGLPEVSLNPAEMLG